MRDYGKVYTAFWTSEDIRSMSEDGRMLALYLMTCPHGNMLGCFRLPNAYAAEDMKWDSERVSKGFHELFEKGFAYRCEKTSWMVIRRYLKWNQFENPNVGKAAAKLFDSLSAPGIVKSLLARALREFCGFFPSGKLDEFESLTEPFENPFETNAESGTTASTTTTAQPEPKIDVEQKPLDLSVQTVEIPEADPVETIFAFWQKVMSSPRSALDSNRKRLITNALKNYSAADICKAIRGCSKSPYNMGQNPQKTKYNGLDLILRNAEKIDRFIQLDSSQAVSQDETLEERNARLIREVMAGEGEGSGVIIEMEP